MEDRREQILNSEYKKWVDGKSIQAIYPLLFPEAYKEAKEVYDNLQKQEEEKSAKYESGRAEYLSNIEAIYSDDFKGFEISSILIKN